MDLLGIIELLVIDTSASWIRMFIALGISVVLAFVIGVLAATSRKAERLILPVVDILQTLPILAFFPFAIVVFVFILPGYIGINAAVIFLIITSMLWNIIFGVYEAVRTIPVEFFEVTELYHFDFWTRLKKLYIPACFPRIVEQSILSWAIGLFYLVTSEIFSTGTANYHVTYGIGIALVQFATNPQDYLLAIAVFVAFVVATRFFFFKPLEDYATRYMKQQVKPKPNPARYEQAVSNLISRSLRATYIREIHNVTKEIKIVKHPNRHLMLPKIEPKNRTRIYAVIAVLIAIIAIYIIASNSMLLADEYQILPALAASFIRIWLAFLVISLITIPICVYLVFISKQSGKYLTLFQVLASIPATILLPLIVEALINTPHHGDVVAFTIFVLSGLWYVVFSVVASTRTLSPTIFEVKKLFGVKGIQAWKDIYLKAILPGFITGAVTAIAAEWNASIVAEYFTSTGITATGAGAQITTEVGVGIGKLLDLALASPNGLLLMELALLNLVVMIILINTFVWKRAYRSVTKVYG